jgi:hypothetical protein
MTQSELNREVASITGESIATISRLLLVGKSRLLSKSRPIPRHKTMDAPDSNPRRPSRRFPAAFSSTCRCSSSLTRSLACCGAVVFHHTTVPAKGRSILRSRPNDRIG